MGEYLGIFGATEMKKLKTLFCKQKTRSPSRIRQLEAQVAELTDRLNDISEIQSIDSGKLGELERKQSLLLHEITMVSNKTKASLTEFETRHLDFLHKLLNKKNSGNED